MQRRQGHFLFFGGLDARAKAVVRLQLEFDETRLAEYAPDRYGYAACKAVVGRLGCPSCSFAELYSAVESPGHTCAKSLVGRGVVNSEIALPGKAPVDVKGRLSAFYVLRKEGRFIMARVRTGAPLPLIYVIPFKIAKGPGAFGTSLVVRRMRAITGICIHPNCFSPYTLKGVYSRISKLQLSLHRRFHHDSTKESFLSARCPARSGVAIPLASVSLDYGSTAMGATVFNDCVVDRRAAVAGPAT